MKQFLSLFTLALILGLTLSYGIEQADAVSSTISGDVIYAEQGPAWLPAPGATVSVKGVIAGFPSVVDDLPPSVTADGGGGYVTTGDLNPTVYDYYIVNAQQTINGILRCGQTTTNTPASGVNIFITAEGC